MSDGNAALEVDCATSNEAGAEFFDARFIYKMGYFANAAPQ